MAWLSSCFAVVAPNHSSHLNPGSPCTAGSVVEKCWRLLLDTFHGDGPCPHEVCTQSQPRAKHSSGSCPSVMPRGVRTLACPVCSWDTRGLWRLLGNGLGRSQHFQGNGPRAGFPMELGQEKWAFQGIWAGDYIAKKGAGRGKHKHRSERQRRRSNKGGGFAVSPALHIQQPWSSTLIRGSLLNTAS